MGCCQWPMGYCGLWTTDVMLWTADVMLSTADAFDDGQWDAANGRMQLTATTDAAASRELRCLLSTTDGMLSTAECDATT